MDDYSYQDLPPRGLDIVKIFLAASSRGDAASLVLENRMGKLTTKYRSVENEAGVPAPTSTLTAKKKMNPARDRRSKARLEEFTTRKIADKKKEAGDTTTSSPTRLILELSKLTDTPVETRLTSNIVQLDGVEEVISLETEETIQFHSFRSDCPEEVICDSLRDIYPEAGATNSTLVLRQRLRSSSEEHVCTVKLKTNVKNFSWSKLEPKHQDIFRELRRI